MAWFWDEHKIIVAARDGWMRISTPYFVLEEEIDRFVFQKNDVFAILTQVNWSPADRWTITGGLRLSWEDKTARLVQINGVPAFFTELTGTLNLDESFERSESHASPRVAVTFDQSDDVSFYASYTEGYRSGGFSSLLSNPEASDLLEFEDETIEAWELGTRLFFPDQKLSLNLALFHMELTDYQLSTDVPVGIFNPPAVVNVGKVEAQGLEADISWNPTDSFSLVGALGYNDTELVDFPAGPCAPDRPNTDGDADSRCDLSGKPLPRAPKWTLTVTPRFTVPVGNYEMFAGLTAEWTASQFLAETIDPRSEEPSFFWLNIDVGMMFGNGWTATLTLLNVTDESVATVVEEIGLSHDTYVQTVRPPRQFFAGVRWEF
jgi:outer membrane receptor protein involved in Fe transport